MDTYQFTLIVEGPDLQSDELVDVLFNVGCDDALIGRVGGVQYLDFDRKAASLEDAVISAVANVETIPGVDVLRLADAGLVSMADIAAQTGRTRESVRLLVTGERGPGGFPPPVTDPRGRYRLWQSAEVGHWFGIHFGNRYEVRDDHMLCALNAGLELRRHSAYLKRVVLRRQADTMGQAPKEHLARFHSEEAQTPTLEEILVRAVGVDD